MTVAKDSRPVVWVLMATFNGASYVTQQVDSILSQRGVDVHLLVSDDGSTDRTLPLLRRYAQNDVRVEVLPTRRGVAGVAGNFFWLMQCCCADDRVKDTDFVAFSDQDDIWEADKLALEIDVLQRHTAQAVSSNVLAFDHSGRTTLIRKDQPQRRWDFVFEAAGPGCTYVFPAPIARQLSAFIASHDVSQVSIHDWYLYALARARGWRWVIVSHPTVRYRQHGHNVQGANSGFSAFVSRFKRLRSGFYRSQFLTVLQGAQDFAGVHRVGVWGEEAEALKLDLVNTSLPARMRLAKRWKQLRRRRLQGFALGLGCLLGIW